MGTDINIYFEVLDMDTKKWVSTDTWEDQYDDGEFNVPYELQIYHGRNYELFAMLANERNDGNITPFALPRGIPEDTDKRIRFATTTFWGEERTSHFTLKELLSFDWEQPVKIKKLVGLKDWGDWQNSLKSDATRLPRSWCAGSNGEIITEDKARELVASIELAKPVNGYDELWATYWRVYVACTWTRPYWFVASEFWGSVIPHMLGLGKPDNVRMVFAFG